MSQPNHFQPWKQNRPLGIPPNVGGNNSYGKLPAVAHQNPPQTAMHHHLHQQQQHPQHPLAVMMGFQDPQEQGMGIQSAATSSSTSVISSSTGPLPNSSGGNSGQGGGMGDFLAQLGANKLMLNKLSASYGLGSLPVGMPLDHPAAGQHQVALQNQLSPLDDCANDKEREVRIQQIFENAIGSTPVSFCQRPLLNPSQFAHRSSLLRYSRQTRNNTRGESFAPKQTIVPTGLQGAAIESGGYIDPSRLWKSFVFTVAFSAGSFVGVTIWEYETVRSRAMDALRAKLNLNWFRERMKDKRREVEQWRKDVNGWWSKLSPGERIFAPICALNVVVFGLWRIPQLQPMMLRLFASNPAAKAVCWPMFLSTFSHYSLFHIAANMYVLHSFCHGAVATLGREQFLGLYLSAGVIASFASHVFKTVMRQPGLSLGASGAIMGILAYVCSQYPDTQLSIVFLPMFTFSAGAAIKVIMGIDLAGVLLGWKLFDHAAHLGGALFGMFWAYYGSRNVWPLREHFIGYWHEWRGPPKK